MQYKQAGQVYSIQIAKQMKKKKNLGCLQIKMVHTMQLLEEVETPEVLGLNLQPSLCVDSEPVPRFAEAYIRPSYLDKEIRRARQEGRDEGKDGTLKGEVGVFLTMR